MQIPAQVLQGLAIGAPLAGGIVQSQAQGASAEAAARASEFNARLAIEQSGREANQIRRQGKRQLDASRREVAASGITLSGSPLHFLVQEAAEIERAALDTQLAGQRTATLDRASASNARKSGKRAGAAALLTGATGALSTGLALRRSGAF